jgi:glutamate synthase domain-containing protein 2
MERKCTKCNIIKPLECFNLDSRGKFGVEARCKSCKNELVKEHKKNTNYDKIYYQNNKISHNQKSKEYIEKNREAYNAYQNQYKKDNKYKSQKKYNQINKDTLLQKSYTRRNQKIKTDPSYKLRIRISTDICNRLRNCISSKKTTTLEYLGCTFQSYKTYLETQFTPEMSWENWGIVWEIDHKISISSFDLTQEKNVFKAFNYQNTQPLFKTTEIAESFGYLDQIGNRNKSNKSI